MSEVVQQVTEEAPVLVNDARSALDNFEPIEGVDKPRFSEPVDDTEDVANDEPKVANEEVLRDEGEAFDPWSVKLPSDPNLPEGYGGKTVKDLYDNERNLIRTLQTYGEDRNTLRAHNQLLLATVKQLSEAKTGKPAGDMTASEAKSFLEQIGVNPHDVFDHPDEVIGKPFEALRKEMYSLIGELKETIQATQQQTADKERLGAIQKMANRAWMQAGQELGLDLSTPEGYATWKQRTEDFVQHVVRDKTRPNPMIDPAAYKEHYIAHCKRWGIDPSSTIGGAQAAPKPPAEVQLRDPEAVNPPHATRTRRTAGGAQKRLPKHIEKEVAVMAAATGRDEDWIRKAFEQFQEG